MKKDRLVYILCLLLFVLPINAKRNNKANNSDIIRNPISCINFQSNIYIPSNKTLYKVHKTTLKGKELSIYLEDAFSNLLFSEELVAQAYDSVRKYLPEEYKNYNLRLYSHNEPIERYVPNYVRQSYLQDKRRVVTYKTAFNVVNRLDKPKPSAGLSDRNIVLMNSHGLYYNYHNERWEWMRPRMFGSVEDLLSTSIAIPFLLPMLENAGAEVFCPRERDFNTNEYKFAKTASGNEFNAIVEQKGEYWVKVRYNKGKKDVKLTVKHAGVESNYQINTQVGYGTWIYVDKLFLDGYTQLTFSSDAKIDSVVVGGGMSHEDSGYPRYTEYALNNLREGGMPDSMTYNQKKGVKSNYYDDIYARSKWTNYLMGGSDRYPSYPGLEIPIDMTLSVHTDAFIRDSDKVIGSLLICTTDSVFPSGYSRFASNDLAYYVGNQIKEDLKASGVDNWEWRGIWHQNMVETRIPMVPTVLCEVHSHQNFADMKIANEPKYKFIFARAIYKAALKFIAAQYNTTYVVQPLPVNSFTTEFASGDSVRLSWKPTLDPIEETAYPTQYIVYTRIGNGAFDSGKIVDGKSVTLPIEKDKIYSYKVVAYNNGGESFPSEILSVCKSSNDTKGTALIVNCFDRVSGPKQFDFGEYAGFSFDSDFGVPYMYDISHTGPQVEFYKCSQFSNNDYPGFGASLGNYETQVIAGNTFDYTFVHGTALKECGYSFVSTSKKGLVNNAKTPHNYSLVDLIYGLERGGGEFELFPAYLQSAILSFTRVGKSVLLSGAYIGQEGGSFASKTFCYTLRSPFAATDGTVALANGKEMFSLQMTPSAERYFLQNVDAIDAKYKGAQILLYYSKNRLPAAVYYERSYKTVVVGFPIEALTSQEQVNTLMRHLTNKF
ncbi:MAG: fibronectin type III domain-containing protein [Paludibacteraceae bacterium]|nr:fibronectin type III domain-containing protein [Paludibacteraceae bacterium]